MQPNKLDNIQINVTNEEGEQESPRFGNPA